MSRSFTSAPSTVRDARRFLREVLGGWAEQGYDFGAALVLTELAINAVLHARTPYEVRLSLAATHLVLEVRDTNPRHPRRRQYGVDATTGRGLALVSTLCSDWGVTATGGDKVVWAHVRPDGVVHAQDAGDQQEVSGAGVAEPVDYRSGTGPEAVSCFSWGAAA